VDVSTLGAGNRVYLDANVWIYALEGYEAFAASLAALFARIDAGELIAVTSELTLAEVLVKPIADGHRAIQDRYLEALQPHDALVLVPVDRFLWINAATLRAHTPALKLPDAVHAVSALATGARDFITNDARFRSVTGLSVRMLG
jgi:predicted nucleic acid-binding protein